MCLAALRSNSIVQYVHAKPESRSRCDASTSKSESHLELLEIRTSGSLQARSGVIRPAERRTGRNLMVQALITIILGNKRNNRVNISRLRHVSQARVVKAAERKLRRGSCILKAAWFYSSKTRCDVHEWRWQPPAKHCRRQRPVPAVPWPSFPPREDRLHISQRSKSQRMASCANESTRDSRWLQQPKHALQSLCSTATNQ